MPPITVEDPALPYCLSAALVKGLAKELLRVGEV